MERYQLFLSRLTVRNFLSLPLHRLASFKKKEVCHETNKASLCWLVFLSFLLFAVLLFSHSSVYGQWTSVTPPTVSGDWYLNAVHFTSENEGWAVGGNVLLHYQNGAWTSVTPPTVSGDWYLNAVHFTSENEGWAVGGNVLLHYQNGAWTSVTPPTVSGDWYLNAVHFTSENEGWAVGGNVLLHYQNGAWTSVTPAIMIENWGVSAVHFTSATEGWAVGVDESNGRGLLLHYQNGDWTLVTPPTVSMYWDLGDVHFTSPDDGWAVGKGNKNGGGVLLHYQNGSWTSVTPPIVGGGWILSAVHFTSENEGWAVGENAVGDDTGVLLHYQNGSWTSASTEIGNWIYGVHFTSATKGWAVGRSLEGGLLLRYSVDLSPNEGTIGTQITITGSGLGTKKGKVLIGGMATKIAKDGWKPDSITSTVSRVPSSGTYDIRVKRSKDADIPFFNAFTVKPPEIDSLSAYEGVVETPITISGRFFGTKKGKVYLENPTSGKKKTCKVKSWGMDSITFIVPKTSKSFPPNTYVLKVDNKIGTAEAPLEFTVD